MQYINASKLSLDSITKDELKEELDKNKYVYLCKICSGNITTYENGICGACQDEIDYGRANNYIDWTYGEEEKYLKELGYKDINEYYNSREGEEKIKIVNDL